MCSKIHFKVNTKMLIESQDVRMNSQLSLSLLLLLCLVPIQSHCILQRSIHSSIKKPLLLVLSVTWGSKSPSQKGQ